MLTRRHLRHAAAALLWALIALCLLWELWLAPIRTGGSWLALKALPLALPLRGIVRGEIYTYRWTTMLSLAYVAEGMVRVYSERGASVWCAALELALAIAFFITAIAYTRPARA
jgi:uncharacterized membrane protein